MSNQRAGYQIKKQYTGLFLLLVTCSLWGSAFVFIRALIMHFTPGALALYRFLIASIMMLILYQRQFFKQKISLSDKVWLIAIGVVGIGIYNTFLNKGEVLISASIASFIIGLIPVVTVILSVIILKEKVATRTYIGIAVALTGLTLLLHDSNADGSIVGETFVLVAMFAGGLYNVLQKKLLAHYHPLQTISWIIWGGTASLSIFSYQLYVNLQSVSIYAHLGAWYLGVFPAALAYLCWSYVCKTISVSNAAVYLYTIPVFATIFGYLFLNEWPSTYQVASGVLALVGAIISHRRI